MADNKEKENEMKKFLVAFSIVIVVLIVLVIGSFSNYVKNRQPLNINHQEYIARCQRMIDYTDSRINELTSLKNKAQAFGVWTEEDQKKYDTFIPELKAKNDKFARIKYGLEMDLKIKSLKEQWKN